MEHLVLQIFTFLLVRETPHNDDGGDIFADFQWHGVEVLREKDDAQM
jgi:hypothetical protein